MGRIAEKVYTDPRDVARLERFVGELAINARVRVHTKSGVVEGVVMVTPTIQVFRDAADNEGINGTVKLEDARQPGWSGLVWLGDIERVEHLDSVTMGATRA
ncbi:Protein of unknown function [Luteibacter sp. UNC138MFCol5.1]|uniref:DUF3247 family protein n=1 Tax=Luteibacter sp. UNC138MFCol5.1 TaxID=1502774 RepID=UPI0008C311E3|nr:DUF3247 family protein [Luteibacter sp. UNC138MFCol5.1]SEO95002.1 Protein of unknown function [Luteibacter sp. UNC138MFCol5.1]